ncbi:MAG: peptidase S10 [Candidatus Sulfotelmatobacter sp.]|jgi:carboxypeptidase C (cathepsin A)
MLKKMFALIVMSILLVLSQASQVAAQEPEKPAEKEAKPADKDAKPAPEPKEESSVTDHTLKIGAQTIAYKATASTTLIKDEKGDPTASIFTIAYTRSDTKDFSQRPISFVYNGGPGSSSIWLHMGAFGPRRVVTTDAGPTPPPPFKLVDNGDCLLDKTDLVFVDPVGTGFSRAVGKSKDKDFWGIDQDVKSLAQFIATYISRNGRWNSPKFLIGESYGTFRSAALGNYLQNHNGMYLNGIVLISSVLDLGTISFPQGNDMPYIFYLPSYAATAYYHKMLQEPPTDLNAFLAEARKFASGEYAAALMKGATLSVTEKADIAKKVSHFTGLSEDYLIKADLRVNLPQFMVELQRSRGLATGRLDARFSGPQPDLLAEYAFDDPQSDAVSGAFVAAFNSYVREDLKFGKDLTYNTSADIHDWDWKRTGGGRGYGFPGAPNVEDDLVEALVTNPQLHVEVENGLYDLATPFFATEFTMTHLGLPENLQKNIGLKYYDAGHMMYLHEEDLAKLKANVASFIDAATMR